MGVDPRICCIRPVSKTIVFVKSSFFLWVTIQSSTPDILAEVAAENTVIKNRVNVEDGIRAAVQKNVMVIVMHKCTFSQKSAV